MAKKKALIFALNLMGASTCCIGMIPAYRNIGDLSTFLLCVFRFCQGLSFAGELPTAALFIQKLYPKTRAYQILSYCLSGTSLGALLASLAVFLLSYACTEKEIVMGYWRLPFLLGLFAVFSSRMISRTFPEEIDEPVYDVKKKQIARKNLLSGAVVSLFFASVVVAHLYFPYWMKQEYGYLLKEIFPYMTLGVVAAIFFQWIVGKLYTKMPEVGFFYSLFQMVFFLPGAYLCIQKEQFLLFFLLYQWAAVGLFTGYFPWVFSLFHEKSQTKVVLILYNSAFCLASILPIGLTQVFSERYFVEGAFLFLGILGVFASVFYSYSRKNEKSVKRTSLLMQRF